MRAQLIFLLTVIAFSLWACGGDAPDESVDVGEALTKKPVKLVRPQIRAFSLDRRK